MMALAEGGLEHAEEKEMQDFVDSDRVIGTEKHNFFHHSNPYSR